MGTIAPGGSLGTRGQSSKAPVENRGKDGVALRPIDMDQTLTDAGSSAEALADQSWLWSRKLSLAIGPDAPWRLNCAQRCPVRCPGRYDRLTRMH